jgi:hypothetical protein
MTLKQMKRAGIQVGAAVVHTAYHDTGIVLAINSDRTIQIGFDGWSDRCNGWELTLNHKLTNAVRDRFAQLEAQL